MTIFAAGAVLWREVDGKLLVAVIHRARYDDWSFPKGKQDPGENLPQTAVREIREETGIKVSLGVSKTVLTAFRMSVIILSSTPCPTMMAKPISLSAAYKLAASLS